MKNYKEKLNLKGETLEEFLQKYNPDKYKKPAVTVDTLIFTMKEISRESKELEILLIKRKNHPCIDQWAIPGGFINIDEDIEAAARRELKEETDVDDVYLEQLHTFGSIGRDPRERTISVSYMALVEHDKLKPKAGDDAAEVAWFTIEKCIIESSEEENKYKLILCNTERKIIMEYTVIEKYVSKGIGKAVETYIEPSKESTDLLAFDHEKMINLAVRRLNTII